MMRRTWRIGVVAALLLGASGCGFPAERRGVAAMAGPAVDAAARDRRR